MGTTPKTRESRTRLVLTAADREFAYQFLSDRESYHHHKETSAYTIFAVEAAFFTALLTTGWYGPIESGLICPKTISLAVISGLWVLVHRFLRWQLINRRIAALQVGALVTALIDSISDDIEAISKEEIDRFGPGGDLVAFLDKWLWPMYEGSLQSDIELRAFPSWYRDRFLDFQYSKATGAITGEMFPTIGSILLFLLFVLYVIFVL